MSQPKPIRQYDASPTRKDAAQNQHVLRRTRAFIEEMLVAGTYGSVELTLTVKDGMLMQDITVGKSLPGRFGE